MSSFTPERIVNARFKNHINAQYVIDASAKSAPQVSQSKNINSTVSDTVIATDKNTLLNNESLGNIVTPEVRYKWGRYDSCQFEENLSLVYEKIVCWKKNLLLLPSGRAGKQFIEETTKLMNEQLHDSSLKDTAFNAIMIMPSLLLQKPSQKSKSREHLKALERRMD